jgi:hypothetical protein
MPSNCCLHKLLSQFRCQSSDSSDQPLLFSKTYLFSIHSSMHGCQWGFNLNMRAQNGWDIEPLSSSKLREFPSSRCDLVPIYLLQSVDTQMIDGIDEFRESKCLHASTCWFTPNDPHPIDESRTSEQVKRSELRISQIHSTFQNKALAIWIGDEAMIFVISDIMISVAPCLRKQLDHRKNEPMLSISFQFLLASVKAKFPLPSFIAHGFSSPTLCFHQSRYYQWNRQENVSQEGCMRQTGSENKEFQ